MDQRRTPTNRWVTSTQPPLYLAGFAIFLFLFGQILSAWAFVDASFVPWTIGNLVSIFALVLALWVVSTRIAILQDNHSRLQRRLLKLERQISSSRQADRLTPTKPERVVIRPKSRKKNKRRIPKANTGGS